MVGPRRCDGCKSGVCLSGYFNDSWKISPTLTVDLGLRYELQTRQREEKDRQAFFDYMPGSNVDVLVEGSDSQREIDTRGLIHVDADVIPFR